MELISSSPLPCHTQKAHKLCVIIIFTLHKKKKPPPEQLSKRALIIYSNTECLSFELIFPSPPPKTRRHQTLVVKTSCSMRVKMRRRTLQIIVISCNTQKIKVESSRERIVENCQRFSVVTKNKNRHADKLIQGTQCCAKQFYKVN